MKAGAERLQNKDDNGGRKARQSHGVGTIATWNNKRTTAEPEARAHFEGALFALSEAKQTKHDGDDGSSTRVQSTRQRTNNNVERVQEFFAFNPQILKSKTY